MDKIKKYLNVSCYKSVGFYFSAVTAVLAVAAAIVYGVGFEKETLSEFYSSLTVILPVLGVVAFILLEVFTKTAPLAPVALWGFVFAGLLTYISTVYMYLPGIFYNGLTAEAFSLLDPAFTFSTVLLVLACVLGNVALWLKQTKPEKGAAAEQQTTGGFHEENL